MGENGARTVGLALLGYGTIGSAVYRMIEDTRTAIQEATGVDLRVLHIVERDETKVGVGAPAELFTSDAAVALTDPRVRIVVELMGGTDAAYEFVAEAFRNGKDVVTANKQLIANRGAALFDLARDLGRQLRFEASVAGAVPVIRVMREGMFTAGLHTVYGIVNGTTNYILSAMCDGAGGYEETLAEAQRLGYAEADPSADVGGADAAAKMAILASIAYRSRVTMTDVAFEGIESVSLEDVGYANDFGFVVKLIGAARLVDGKVSVRVHPALIPKDHLLASISGSLNAVYLRGDALGEIMLTGPGAGGEPTATAVVGDVVTVAGTESVGFLQNCSCYRGLPFLPAEELRSAFFVRMKVEDRAGVLAQISSVFAKWDVSIESMIQRGHGDEAELVFITYPSVEAGFFRSIEEITGLSCSQGPPMTIRVL